MVTELPSLEAMQPILKKFQNNKQRKKQQKNNKKGQKIKKSHFFLNLTTKKDFNALKRGSSMKAMITNRMVPRKL
jgi:hypothetical protein